MRLFWIPASLQSALSLTRITFPPLSSRSLPLAFTLSVSACLSSHTPKWIRTGHDEKRLEMILWYLLLFLLCWRHSPETKGRVSPHTEEPPPPPLSQAAAAAAAVVVVVALRLPARRGAGTGRDGTGREGETSGEGCGRDVRSVGTLRGRRSLRWEDVRAVDTTCHLCRFVHA